MNSRFRTIFLLGVLTLLGCQQPQQVPTPPSLIGEWRQSALLGDTSKDCQEATIEFRGDGNLMVRTGRLILTSTYTVADLGGRLVLLEDKPHSNGQPNCQGIPGQVVVDHYVPQVYMQLSPDTLSLYLYRSDTVPAVSYIRIH